MRVSQSSRGCDADQVAKIGGENRALVDAEGRLGSENGIAGYVEENGKDIE